ncbi:MAG: PhoH family protein [Bdellovibrionales bacterium]|nr:PhoH family protein [Bdellovibrionales bacterium]
MASSFKAQTKEEHLAIPNPEVLLQLTGAEGAHLRELERLLDIRISQAPGEIVLVGQDSEVDLAFNLLRQLAELVERGEKVFAGDFERSLQMLSENRHLRLEDLFRDQVKIAGRKRSITPKTFRQKEYIEAIKDNDIVFGIGPAGTGKTYLAMAMAVAALVKKDVKRVVLCRPAVEAGEKLGFLPGDMAEKVNPYLRPLYDALHDMVDFDRAAELVEKGQVEVAPLAFMRGRTLSNAFVILDEAQNTTSIQMKMLLTRLGRGSKCVITGDITQIDLPHGTVSGLSQAVRVLKDIPGIHMLRFTKEDVIRHPLVSRIVDAYDRESKDSNKTNKRD